MASYSVATTRDNLSSLIDKAMAGEEVIITRHGKQTVSLEIVEKLASEIDWEERNAWAEKMTSLRESVLSVSTSEQGVVSDMRDEYRY